MSLDLFGPASAAGSVTSRPSENRAFGTADTFFRDCTSPDLDDGTEFQAAWFNQVLANMRALARGNGVTAASADVVTQDNGSDNLLLQAVQHLVQRGQILFGADTSSTPGTVTVALSPAPPEYKRGMVVHVLMANDCIGASVISLNGLGNKSIVKKPGSQALVGGEWKAGDIVAMQFDGTNWQGLGLGQRAPLTAAVDIYVNPTTGSDTLYDGTAATVTGAHGPFATLTKALAYVSQFAPGTFGATIHLSAGTHNGGAVSFQTAVWAHCPVTITGAGVASTLLTTTSATSNSTFANISPTQYTIQNMDVSHQGSAQGGYVIGTSGIGASLRVQNVRYMGNSCPGSGFIGSANGEVDVIGTITLRASVGSNFFWASGSGAQVIFATGCIIDAGGGAYSASGGFVNATNSGYIGAQFNPTLSGAGSMTGPRYNVSLNGVINTAGAGTGFFPGNSSGLSATGGQYA